MKYKGKRIRLTIRVPVEIYEQLPIPDSYGAFNDYVVALLAAAMGAKL